ncbi:MAG: LysR family transcriptional regulator [Rubrivivax sp.]|nr:LysR family transcriptional regulator [Rubrivivax sp.]
MRFNGLDLNLLVALDTLLAEGGVTRAAVRMHLSQSAMSGALARLREHFGDELFVPVGRKVVRTPLAEALAAPVRDILMRIDAAMAQRPAFDPATSTRRFVIAASDYVIAVLLERLLAHAWREAPGVGFELLPVDAGLEMLERGEIDLLLLPREFALAEHPSETAFADSYTCVVWDGDASIGRTLSLKRYLAAGHVATYLGPGRAPTFEAWAMKRFGIERRIEVRTYSLASCARLVVGTGRIATVHTRLAQQLAAAHPLRLLAPPVAIPEVVIAMQWHRHKALDPGLAWLRRLVHETAAEEPPAPVTPARSRRRRRSP